MTIKDLKHIINTSEKQETRNQYVKILVTNKELPLEERWELYILSVEKKYLIEKDYVYFIPVFFNDKLFTLYDNACVDRHQTYDYTAFTNNFEGTTDELNIIKEEILQECKSSWINDW